MLKIKSYKLQERRIKKLLLKSPFFSLFLSSALSRVVCVCVCVQPTSHTRELFFSLSSKSVYRYVHVSCMYTCVDGVAQLVLSSSCHS
jgi:hypothetical protein